MEYLWAIDGAYEALLDNASESCVANTDFSSYANQIGPLARETRSETFGQCVTCSECVDGTWDHDDDDTSACIAHTECDTNATETVAGNATTDTGFANATPDTLVMVLVATQPKISAKHAPTMLNVPAVSVTILSVPQPRRCILVPVGAPTQVTC